jgi:hypothetical protein
MKVIDTLAMLLLLHGEYGWQGFVLVAIGCAVAILIFNELAARSLKNKRRGLGRRRR